MQNPETLFMGQNLIHLLDVDSTNNFAANMIKQTKVMHGTVILADNQTAGRGQSGNSWHVEPGSNLTLSVILKPKLDIQKQFLISKITCLALIETLRKFSINAKIKWPNDILVGQQKISGILIENTVKGGQIDTSIIGIGLNVNQKFKGELNATSIVEQEAKDVSTEFVFNELMRCLEAKYLLLERNKMEQINEAYLNKLFGLNILQEYATKDRKFKGTITGVNQPGQLQLTTEKGEHLLFNNQEVKFVLS